MTKDKLLEKLEDKGYQFKKLELISDIKSLPNVGLKFSPNVSKVGDIRFHGKLGHYIVLVSKKKDNWIALLLTTNEILEAPIAIESRCLNGFISNALIQIKDQSFLELSFAGNYDNTKHLRQTYKLIKNILC